MLLGQVSLLAGAISEDEFLAVFIPINLVLALVGVVAIWKVFSKAAQPGWAALIPIYHTVVLLRVVGRPIWWILLLLIPCVGIVIAIILMVDLAKSYGKGGGFATGLILLPFIFLPILAFGSAQYQGPAAAPSE